MRIYKFMKEKLTLDDMQQLVDGWIQKYGGYWSPLSMLSAVLEELGEVSREINYLEGNKPKKDTKNKSNLQEEIADLIFSVICIANHYKINLSEEFHKVIEKYTKRDSKRFS